MSPHLAIVRGETEPDHRLAARCREGDGAAWEALYRRFARPISVYLRRLIGPVPDIEDLVQEVFVVVFRSLDQFRGDSSLSGWIYGIATHVAQRHQRWRFRWWRRGRDLAAWMETFAPRDPDVADGHPARASLAVLGEVLEGMGHRQRAVWVLREFEGLSTEEVAASLSIPAGTVRSRLFQARQSIQAALAAAGLDGAGVGGQEHALR